MNELSCGDNKDMRGAMGANKHASANTKRA